MEFQVHLWLAFIIIDIDIDIFTFFLVDGCFGK